MKLSHHPAFTFVELLIVITILSILSVMALIDYGFSIKKARLQVATAEVVALMQEAQVKAQTSYSQEDESGNEYVVCWGVVVSSSDAPMMVQVLWNEEDQTCSSDTADWEEADSLFWGETMGIARIEWESVSSIGADASNQEDSLAILYYPPNGAVLIYVDSTSPTLITDVTNVEIQVSYDRSTDDVLNKTIQFTPVTSSIVVTSGDGDV